MGPKAYIVRRGREKGDIWIYLTRIVNEDEFHQRLNPILSGMRCIYDLRLKGELVTLTLCEYLILPRLVLLDIMDTWSAL